MYDFYRSLIVKNDARIVLLVMDGLGGAPLTPGGPTELAAARTPHLDRLARLSSCGLLEPILPGVTPGSGPSHMALFGYDPLKCLIGRGVMEALGASFDVRKGDLCIRINFATVDGEGRVTDRRAGRIGDDEMRRICGKLQAGVAVPGAELVFWPVKEHRAALIVRAGGLYDGIRDTDPQATGVPPLGVVADDPGRGAATVALLEKVIAGARGVLADEERANAILLRGISFYHPLEPLQERFGLNPLGLACYPMYRGLARLAGMTVDERPRTFVDVIDRLEEAWGDYDYFFLHFKKTDSTGEDGDFDAKVARIEEADALIPRIEALKPDVLAVTGDHATPAVLRSHSWHPVPLLISSPHSLSDGLEAFDEVHCARGTLGLRPTLHLMGLLLGHARKLAKYGA